MTFNIARVSSLALQQSTLRDSSLVQSRLYDLQNQLSSGYKASTFSGMAADTEQFLALEQKISKSDSYVQNNKVVSARVELTSNVLGQIIDKATELRNLILTKKSAASGDNLAFSEQINAAWQSITGLLNTNSEGRYLFSGTRTNAPAVNQDEFPKLDVSGVPDANYYLGSKEDTVVRPADNTEMVVNVRADAPGFQNIFAGLAMAKKGQESNAPEDLTSAYELVSAGITDIIGTQATVNANKVAIADISDRHESLKLYFKGLKEDIGNTDLVSVSTEVAINQGILQATFQAFAKINSLKLSDFLR